MPHILAATTDINADPHRSLQRSIKRFRSLSGQQLHTPHRGRAEVLALATMFREAFPDLAFSGTADLIPEGDYVVGQWDWRRHPHRQGVRRAARRFVPAE